MKAPVVKYVRDNSNARTIEFTDGVPTREALDRDLVVFGVQAWRELSEDERNRLINMWRKP